MFDSALIISILVFAGITLMSSGVYSYINFRRSRTGLVNKVKHGTDVTSLEPVVSHSRKSRDDSVIKKYLSKFFMDLGALSNPEKAKNPSHMRKGLVQAGYRNRNALIIFYGVKIFLATFIFIAYFFYKVLLAVFIPDNIELIAIPALNALVYSIAGAFVGFYLPNLWLKHMISSRQTKILEGLPDALDLMIVCVEAGMGLDAAIAKTASELKVSNKEVSEEFKLVSLELRAGKLRRDALRNMAIRIGLEDVNSLVSLLIQTDRFGTSVAQALRVHADSMRNMRFQRAEELAAKLPVKLVFPLIVFIFPSIFVVLLGPAMIRIYTSIFPVLGG